MIRCMPNNGKYMRTFLLYRGDVNAIQIKKSVQKLLQLKNMKFVQKHPVNLLLNCVFLHQTFYLKCFCKFRVIFVFC